MSENLTCIKLASFPLLKISFLRKWCFQEQGSLPKVDTVFKICSSFTLALSQDLPIEGFRGACILATTNWIVSVDLEQREFYVFGMDSFLSDPPPLPPTPTPVK